jgi:hypothetical protein
MAITASQQEVWSAKIAENLDAMSVYEQALTNSDYEGDAATAKTVHIIHIGDVSVDDYTGAWTDADWEDLDDDALSLAVDQEKYFRFKVKDTDQYGSTLRLIDIGSQRAAFAIKDTRDQFLASLHSQASSDNDYGTTGAPITIGLGTGEVRPSTALARQVEALTVSKVKGALNAVVPPWFGTMLLKELGINRETAMGDAGVKAGVQEGLIVSGVNGIAGVYVSNNVANTTATKYKIMVGPNPITLAQALQKVETVRLQNDFATGVKGLYVYGAKIIQPLKMSVGTYNKGAYE